MTYQQCIGSHGEGLAAHFLQDKGYQILDKNYTSRYGELDLVAMDSDMVVFVEVKTRTSQRFGLPEASVTPDKLTRVVAAGLIWLQEHPEVTDVWRIDVIAVILDRSGHVEDIQHFINVDL